MLSGWETEGSLRRGTVEGGLEKKLRSQIVAVEISEELGLSRKALGALALTLVLQPHGISKQDLKKSIVSQIRAATRL